MREKSKRKILVVGIILAIFMCIGIGVYVNFEEILFRVNPKLYVKKSISNLQKEVGMIADPLLSNEANISFEAKVEGIETDGEEKIGVKGITIGVECNADKKKGKYGVSAYAGVGSIKMYKANVYADSKRFVLDIPQYNENPVQFSWEALGEKLGISGNLYECIHSIDFGAKLSDAIENAEYECVDRKQRKVKVTFHKEHNPLPFEVCYVYINDNHVMYKLESDILNISLSRDGDMVETISIDVSHETLGKFTINAIGSSIEYETYEGIEVEKMTITYENSNTSLKVTVSGKYETSKMRYEQPDFDDENTIDSSQIVTSLNTFLSQMVVRMNS